MLCVETVDTATKSMFHLAETVRGACMRFTGSGASFVHEPTGIRAW